MPVCLSYSNVTANIPVVCRMWHQPGELFLLIFLLIRTHFWLPCYRIVPSNDIFLFAYIFHFLRSLNSCQSIKNITYNSVTGNWGSKIKTSPRDFCSLLKAGRSFRASKKRDLQPCWFGPENPPSLEEILFTNEAHFSVKFVRRPQNPTKHLKMTLKRRCEVMLGQNISFTSFHVY